MKVTEEAQKELKKALEHFNKQGAGIHIFKTQGCCGPSIHMDIATQVGKGETVISLGGIDFFISKDLLPQLENVTIEYSQNAFRLEGLQKNGGSCCG